MLVSQENLKLWKGEFKRERLEFDCLGNGNVFDWQLKHIYGTSCFIMLQYCELLRLMQILWNLAWQVLHEIWCFLDFTFLLKQLLKTLVEDDVIFK